MKNYAYVVSKRNWKVTDFEHLSIEELTYDFGKEDVIISSDLLLPEICQRLNEPEYDRWNTSFDVCSKMLEAYSKLTKTISLENLIEAMQ